VRGGGPQVPSRRGEALREKWHEEKGRDGGESKSPLATRRGFGRKGRQPGLVVRGGKVTSGEEKKEKIIRYEKSILIKKTQLEGSWGGGDYVTWKSSEEWNFEGGHQNLGLKILLKFGRKLREKEPATNEGRGGTGQKTQGLTSPGKVTLPGAYGGNKRRTY